MPVIQRKGAQSSQGFGEFTQVAAPVYIENVFSTYLYEGDSTANHKITNNINLSGYGGLVWLKNRTSAFNNYLTTTATGLSTLGRTTWLYSNTTDSLLGAIGSGLCQFYSDGFDINPIGIGINQTGSNYVSWTFRKQPKFFDVVTYTGTGANRTIAHNLGSTPGCIFVKQTTSASTTSWYVYHQSLGAGQYINLNATNAAISSTTIWNNTSPTSSVFSVGTPSQVNFSGGTYVAYLFASNAGGFGASATDNVITCGSYIGNGSPNGPTITLGYEPQWVLIKDVSRSQNWVIFDTMRGMSLSNSAYLYPNTSDAEGSFGSSYVVPTATGFTLTTGSNLVNNGTGPDTYIYIAIRRGPMKTPTTGTSVYSPVVRTGTGAAANISSLSFPPDMAIIDQRSGGNSYGSIFSKLTGPTQYLITQLTASESTDNDAVLSFNETGISLGSDSTTGGLVNGSGNPYINWFFQRAPGFFDEVCYTGTGANTTQTHNLGVVPELMIVKERDAINNWQVYSATLANTQYLVLNTTAAAATGTTRWNSTTPTSSVFSVGTDATVNTLAGTYAAYLFASCPGVSKVGSYTGTGATQTIDCGFTGGARFVLIKRTNSTGDWYVWDTARGMVAGTDPYLLLNTTAAQVNANNVYTATGGFQIVGTGAGINASAGSYIYLAIA